MNHFGSCSQYTCFFYIYTVPVKVVNLLHLTYFHTYFLKPKLYSFYFETTHTGHRTTNTGDRTTNTGVGQLTLEIGQPTNTGGRTTNTGDRTTNMGDRTTNTGGNNHSWASASRKLTPASAFRHPLFQSGTRPKKLDCICLVRYRIGPGAVSFYHSSTGLIVCRTVQHSGIYTHAHKHAHKHAYAHEHAHKHTNEHPHTHTRTRTRGLDIDMDMQHGNGHAPWTQTSSMDARMPMKSLVRHR
jgi:hypothetical protein